MRWVPRQTDEIKAQHLAASAGISLLVARLLVARGVEEAADAARFLSPSISDLHSADLMLGLRKAVDRLAAAIATKERVLIFGDYDVDGTTAVVILKIAIELCKGTAEFHIPHRIRDGYGIQDDVVERAAASGVTLMISVDTGIRAFSAADTARRMGVDLIVTDHHLPQAEEGVPPAYAVLNPNQAGCEYPCKSLCGAGVAFKLAGALLEKILGPEECARLLPSFLKMVAIATIADAVPLTGENRIFVKLGLEGLRRPVNPGLKALLRVAGLQNSSRLNPTDVGFRLAPRLNAAGRMDVAEDVIELFTSKDETRIAALALKLDHLNGERQLEEARILKEIYKRLDEDTSASQAHCIVIDGVGWHRGVIGITATRVVERYSRPTLVIAHDGDDAHGSGRSLPNFHLLEALESCGELFQRFGGHAHAVGFALPGERVPQLRAAMIAFARTRLTLEDLQPMKWIDAEISLEQVTPGLLRELRQLEPFGHSNPEPVFVSRNCRVATPPKVMKDIHVKLRLLPAPPSQAKPLDALGWRMAENVQKEKILAGDRVDVAYKIEENEHPDFGGLQINLCDILRTPAETPNPAVEAISSAV